MVAGLPGRFKFRCVPHLTGRRFEHGVTDVTLFRDAYHLAGIEMPDFHRGMTGGVTVRIYLDNLEATGLYQVPLSAAQPAMFCCAVLVHRCRNHAAIYCGDGELLHHIPEQLSEARGIPTTAWRRRTHSLWRHRAWRASAFYGDLQRFGPPHRPFV